MYVSHREILSQLLTLAYDLLSVKDQSGSEYTLGELHAILMKLQHDTNSSYKCLFRET